jgi:hypothetical protein
MIGPQILAQAVVDVAKFPCEADLTPFRVTCWGELITGDKLPRRVYQIAAATDDIAGRAGLDLYVADMQRPN